MFRYVHWIASSIYSAEKTISINAWRNSHIYVGEYVTFVVCVQLAPNSDVSTAFWVTLKHDVTRVAMAAHEY